MRFHSRFVFGVPVLFAGLIVLTANAAQAATVTSADFSFGFGATGVDPDVIVWTNSENVGTNSATTQGNFTFAPAPSGPRWSNSGPIFNNTTLADGTSTSYRDT